MKKLLCLSLLLSLVSCSYFETKVVPKAKIAASASITKALVKEGQCANVEAVKADVDKLLKIESDESVVIKALAPEAVEVQSLSATPSTKLAAVICKSAASLAIPSLLKKGVPEAWGCSLTDLSGKIELLASNACDKI